MRDCSGWLDPFYASRTVRFLNATNDLARAVADVDVKKAVKAAGTAAAVAAEMSSRAPARRLLALEEKKLAAILPRLEASKARQSAPNLYRMADDFRRKAEGLRDRRDDPDFVTAAATLAKAVSLYEQAITAASLTTTPTSSKHKP